MKQVSNTPPVSNIVYIDNVSTEKYYGIINKMSIEKQKGLIIQENFNYGVYKVYAIDKITNGNKWSQYERESLKGVILALLHTTLFTIHEFDTAKEIFKWLSE